MKLNENQEAAASYNLGACLVSAGPGSGKTKTLTERVCRLIKSGVNPSSLICITFTNKAACEMSDRVEKAIGKETASKIWISTFHKLCLSILRKNGHEIGYSSGITICMPNDQLDLISQCARQLEYEVHKNTLKRIIWHINDARENLESQDVMDNRLSIFEKSLRGEYTIASGAAKAIADEYFKRLKISNQIDFTGMLSETVKLLKSSPETLAKIHNRCHYIMIDEFQDTNYCQMVCIDLLAGERKNVFAIGDLDQSIYMFRGARPKNINDFCSKYNPKLIRLGKNYRSTPQIVAAADNLIRCNPNRLAADFSTDNPSGNPVICKQLETSDHEAAWIATSIENLIKNGVKKSEIAILYRINTMSRALEIALMKRSIPYSLIGDYSFFDRKEIKDCIAMLRFLVNPKDGVAYHRLCNKPKRNKLGDATVGKLEKYANNYHDGNILEASTDIGKFIKSMSVQESVLEIYHAFKSVSTDIAPSLAIANLVKALRYEDYLKEEADNVAEFENRKANIEELVNDAAKFHQDGKGGVQEYLESICLSNQTNEDEKDVVQISSIHSSKGREFDAVFVCGVEAGIMPHSRAVQESDEGIFEERRVAYVAVSRARKILALSYTKKRAKSAFYNQGKITYQDARPSQFLYEMKLLKGYTVDMDNTHKEH